MTIRRLLPLAALLTVFALIGCGGSSSQPSASDAKTAYAPIRAQIVALGDSIAVAIAGASGENDAQLATAFHALADRGHAAVARLDSLDVPDSLTAKRNALRDAVAKGTDDLTGIATAASSSDAAAARTAAAKLLADSGSIRSARSAFEQAVTSAAR